MPFINVKANIPISDSAEQAMKRQLGQAIEALPGKTEAWLMVNFEPEARLWFAGSDDAAAMVEVSAYGSVADEAADALTARVCDVIAGALGIAENRIYVKYAETPLWGWKDRKSTRLNSSHKVQSRMPSSA